MNPVLRILLLVFLGFVVASGTLRTILTIRYCFIDLSRGGNQAPELLGTIVGTLLVTVLFGWVWRKVYLSKR
ncbi:hypothetical protein [Actomonas aquatica]|uniref:Uncharacterized protein n=1 Tax=Actomonas aquatica TaxID=2866162 RepID=A0ABZ1CC27_9BACT|nr:hypothetical protein [Opitutus sp. WL0086]WRQ89233.1 hypothetical protein K1X11_007420 [Opitutus sp. WL0086]